MTTDLLTRAKQMDDIDVTRSGEGLSSEAVTRMLGDAGVPEHQDLLALYTHVNGMSLASAQLELWIWSLEEMLEQDAWAHMLEVSGLDDDADEREDFAPYHVFAKHERSLWLVNLQTLETAWAFDFDVEPLPWSFAQMLERLVDSRFAPDWYAQSGRPRS